jgi:hypothetical protein
MDVVICESFVVFLNVVLQFGELGSGVTFRVAQIKAFDQGVTVA